MEGFNDGTLVGQYNGDIVGIGDGSSVPAGCIVGEHDRATDGASEELTTVGLKDNTVGKTVGTIVAAKTPLGVVLIVDGITVGISDGIFEGASDGVLEGSNIKVMGDEDFVIIEVGRSEGWIVGCDVGCFEGCDVGFTVGCTDGCRVGNVNGCKVGVTVGCEEGSPLGCFDG